MKERYFKFAREAARWADYQGANASPPAIGGVAVYKGSIVAEAWNTNKTSPLQAHYNVYRYNGNTPCKCHCETQLIQRLRWKFGDGIEWEKVHIYLYREYKNGNLALSRPCPSCMAMLKDFGIKKVMYTTTDGFVEEKLRQ